MGTKRRRDTPEVGQTIGLDRAAYIVTHASPATATEEEDDYLKHQRADMQERRGPWNLTLRRVHGPVIYRENEFHETAIRVPAGYWQDWQVYEEDRVPLCSCCQHPWPCIMTTSAKDAKQQSAILEEKMNNAKPGHCYSCGEIISTRQQFIRYPEDNVELPGFPPPSFHLRNACADGQRAYEKSRTKALPDAPVVWAQDQTGRLL